MSKKLRKAILLFWQNPFAFFELVFKYLIALINPKILPVEQKICIIAFSFFIKGKYFRQISTVPWIIILYTDNKFFKISWRKDCIINEINNLEFVNRVELLRKLLIPYIYKRRLCCSIIETQRKIPVNDANEFFTAAERILDRFQLCAELKSNCDLSEFKLITEGLSIIKESGCYNEWLICENQVKQFFDKESFYIGPAHGDFHQKNILKDEDGNYFIIDLDCFRPEGIMALDAIYFIIQYYVNLHRVNWYEQLISFTSKRQEFTQSELKFLNKYCKISNIQWLMIFFLDRIGQERQYVGNSSEILQKVIVQFLNVYQKTQSQVANHL